MAEWYALARIGQGSDAFKKSVTLDLTKLPEKIRDLFRPTNKQRNNFDFVQTKDGIIYEVKAGYPNGAVDLDQMHNYNLIVSLSKKLDHDINSALTDIKVAGGILKRTEYIVLPGKSSQINGSANVAESIRIRTGKREYEGNFLTKYFDPDGEIQLKKI